MGLENIDTRTGGTIDDAVGTDCGLSLYKEKPSQVNAFLEE